MGCAGVFVVLSAVVFGLAVVAQIRIAREQSSGSGSVIDEYQRPAPGNGSVIDEHQRPALYQRLYEVAQEQSRQWKLNCYETTIQ